MSASINVALPRGACTVDPSPQMSHTDAAAADAHAATRCHQDPPLTAAVPFEIAVAH